MSSHPNQSRSLERIGRSLLTAALLGLPPLRRPLRKSLHRFWSRPTRRFPRTRSRAACCSDWAPCASRAARSTPPCRQRRRPSGEEQETPMASATAINAFTRQPALAIVGVSRSGGKFGNLARRELASQGYRVYPI